MTPFDFGGPQFEIANVDYYKRIGHEELEVEDFLTNLFNKFEGEYGWCVIEIRDKINGHRTSTFSQLVGADFLNELPIKNTLMEYILKAAKHPTVIHLNVRMYSCSNEPRLAEPVSIKY